ncbi:MAG: hypothetical protein FJX67_16770, partial [Alphaproteobacteria bacterium]|nr:hypothetical protein [Alphaproteobacteria bacterium]
MRWYSGLALLAVIAAGCQPMPRPFGNENAVKRNPLLALADRGGVVVLDVDGAPPAAAARLPAA